MLLYSFQSTDQNGAVLHKHTQSTYKKKLSCGSKSHILITVIDDADRKEKAARNKVLPVSGSSGLYLSSPMLNLSLPSVGVRSWDQRP